MKTKSLVVINDLHAGSKYAAIPEGWKMKDGLIAPTCEANHWLYECYIDWAKEFKKPDILVVNGDAVDGHQHLNYGAEVWSTDGYDQYLLAKHLIELYDAKELYVVFGTPYHVAWAGTPVEQFIAESLHAKGCGWSVVQEWLGRKCVFSHHISVSASNWQYRTTPLARELVMDRLEWGTESAQLAVYSHAHYFCAVQFSDSLAIISPGFQGQTPYMARKMPRVRSKIGMIAIELPSLNFVKRVRDGPKLEMQTFE